MRVAVLIVSLVSSTLIAATVDPPQQVKVIKLDGSAVAGRITAYDDKGFEVMDAKKQTVTVAWEELPADVIISLNERLVRKGSGEEWMKLGEKLLTMPGGRAPAERAFQRAQKADPSLKPKLDELRKEANLKRIPPAKPTTQPGQTLERPVLDPRDPDKRMVGPQEVGETDPSQWGKQTPEQMKASVERLKQFATETQQKMGVKLSEFETNYFLFYTDLPQSEAGKWAQTLDRLYTRLAQLFAVPQGENIWRGKALVFIFAKDSDYLSFQSKMHNTIAAGTAGMCHSYGNGDVHIAFYRKPNDLDFAHVLVHESTHGFLHRYRSPVHIPSWANEGLAEVIASEMVPRAGLTQSSTAEAKSDLQTRKSLERFYDEDHIVAWQYPVARTLCEFMIRQNKQGYVDFINGIKDGQSWEDAMQQKYGVSVKQLTSAYGMAMGVKDLKSE